MMLSRVLAAAAAALSCSSASSLFAFSPVPVFESYQVGQPACYRQPILLSLGDNTLVALAEGRNISGGCSGTYWPDVPDFPIVARTSIDGGQTWSPSVSSGGGTVITHGNLDFLTAVVEAASGSGPSARPATIHLTVQSGDAGTVYFRSTDGVEWASMGPLYFAAPPEVVTAIPGCGHGLQVRGDYCSLAPGCAGEAGRLVLPFVCTTAGDVSNDTACGNCHTCLLTSDDSGSSWQLRALSEQNGSREAALLQLDSSLFGAVGAALYAGERNLGNNTGTRWHAVSRDGGSSFDGSLYGVDAALPDCVTANWTGVVSGFARVDTVPAPASSATAPVLVFTAPANHTERQGLSAWASLDQGASWTKGPLSLWPGPAAYSDLIALNSTHVAVLFENGDAGSGDFAMRISFGVVAVADVLAA